MISQYIIQQILNSNKISDYLSSKGHFSARVNGEKTWYLCPIPSHVEKSPSFCVYAPNQETPYENYYCFGCKSHSTIINLVASLEFNNDWFLALKHLAKDSLDLDQSFDGEISFILAKLKKQIEENDKSRDTWNEFESLSLQVSSICRSYILQTNKDKEELDFMEKVYRKIDKYIVDNDIEKLRSAYNFLADSGAMNKRVENYLKKHGLD